MQNKHISKVEFFIHFWIFWTYTIKRAIIICICSFMFVYTHDILILIEFQHMKKKCLSFCSFYNIISVSRKTCMNTNSWRTFKSIVFRKESTIFFSTGIFLFLVLKILTNDYFYNFLVKDTIFRHWNSKCILFIHDFWNIVFQKRIENSLSLVTNCWIINEQTSIVTAMKTSDSSPVLESLL